MTTKKIPEHKLGQAFSKWELTIRDTFSLPEFYKRVHTFLNEEGWKDLTSEKLRDCGDDYETYYYEKNESGAKFNVIWWRAQKEPVVSGANYVHFYMILDFDTKFMKPKEIIHNGQKVTLDNGELKVTCELFLVDNHEQVGREWDANPILSYFKKSFWDRTNKGVLGACKGEIVKFSNDLYQLIQTYAGIRPEGDMKDFIPMKGTHN